MVVDVEVVNLLLLNLLLNLKNNLFTKTNIKMETKKWFQSTTIWGVIIAALGFVITKFLGVSEITLPENADFDQLKAYADAIKAAQGSLPVIIGQVLAAVGTVVSIIGRIKADTKVTL